MKIYIVDSERDSRLKLKRMVEQHRFGMVTGMSSRWEDAYLKVRETRPELILTDLVQPGLKALQYTQRVKKILPDTTVIMFSQISQMDIIKRAYEKGVAFFLHKPIIDLEAQHAISHVEMTRQMQWLITRAVTDCGDLLIRKQTEQHTEQAAERNKTTDETLRSLKRILQELGILNEAGSKDMIRMIGHLLETGMDFNDIPVSRLCVQLNQNTKSTEQRIRRAAGVGMATLANKGIEDDQDPVFLEYAARLFTMEQMKREISYIQGDGESHGNIRIRKFLNGLLDCCREGS